MSKITSDIAAFAVAFILAAMVFPFIPLISLVLIVLGFKEKYFPCKEA